MAVLVTGGTGYIGSHTVVELIEAGYEPIIVDNLYNSKELVLDRIEQITGKSVKFYKGDILCRETLDKIFDENPSIDSCIHFAGYKAVGESVQKPIEYYHNNVCGTLVLLDAMRAHNVKKIVFSSSATVYGTPEKLPITEDAHVGEATNPYGDTKIMIERILHSLYRSDNTWRISILRYFNPIGAHKSGLIGEDPSGIPNNLVPFIARVATGKIPCLNVFGNDYDTPDGTGVRDYIHVVDLARAHICALEYMNEHEGIDTFNIGTGKGYSVLDVVKAYEKASGAEVKYRICERRAGDIARCYADPSKAKRLMGWQAQYGIEQMCADSHNWQTKNPDGYKEI